MTSQYFDTERTWSRLFQKRVVRTKFDIQVFSTMYLCKPILIIDPTLTDHCYCKHVTSADGKHFELITNLNNINLSIY